MRTCQLALQCTNAVVLAKLARRYCKITFIAVIMSVLAVWKMFLLEAFGSHFHIAADVWTVYLAQRA